jgi:hypothetical protein
VGTYEFREPLHRQAHIDSLVGEEWMFPGQSHTGKAGRYMIVQGKIHPRVGEFEVLKREA